MFKLVLVFVLISVVYAEISILAIRRNLTTYTNEIKDNVEKSVNQTQIKSILYATIIIATGYITKEFVPAIIVAVCGYLFLDSTRYANALPALCMAILMFRKNYNVSMVATVVAAVCYVFNISVL